MSPPLFLHTTEDDGNACRNFLVKKIYLRLQVGIIFIYKSGQCDYLVDK